MMREGSGGAQKGGVQSWGARLAARRHGPVVVRVGLGCLVAAGVCLAQLSSSSSGADTSFVPGTASSSAQAIQVAPTTGGLSYDISLATSAADYQNTEGQALSQTLDLGAIGTAITGDSCTGGPPDVSPSQLPQPLQAESTSGNQSLTGSEEDSLAPTGAGVGSESANATTQPTGSATTTIVSDNLAGLVNVMGATSSANAALQNGATRYASATSDISTVTLDNGLISLGGLHWVATQTSGASSTSSATFDISNLTVAGTTVPVSNDSVSTILDVINTALSPVGLQVVWPQQVTQSDGTILITPLIIGIDNNELGQEVIGANESKVETERDALQQELLNINCNTADGLLIGDIGMGVLSGGGNLNLELGGASAVTTDAAFVSPFGSVSLGSAGGDSTDLPSTASTPASTFGTPAVSGSSGLAPTSAPAAAATGGTVALGPLEKSASCISLGPAGGGCSDHNVALPVGLLGLTLLGALGAWDYMRQRRRSRLSELEAS
jgi:hypothetical protein